MAASLRSTSPVAKAVLPNRMGRIVYRLSRRILTGNRRAGITFRWSGIPRFRLDRRARPTLAPVGSLPRRAFQADALASLCQCLRLVIAGDIRAAIENLGVSLCNAAVKIQELRIEIAARFRLWIGRM